MAIRGHNAPQSGTAEPLTDKDRAILPTMFVDAGPNGVPPEGGHQLIGGTQIPPKMRSR